MEEEAMTQRMIVRSLLAVLVSLSLAAPAAAAAPAQPADGPRSGWLVDLGDLLSRAWGLVFDDWAGEGMEEREPSRDRTPAESDGRLQSVSGEDSSDWDPNG